MYVWRDEEQTKNVNRSVKNKLYKWYDVIPTAWKLWLHYCALEVWCIVHFYFILLVWTAAPSHRKPKNVDINHSLSHSDTPLIKRWRRLELTQTDRLFVSLPCYVWQRSFHLRALERLPVPSYSHHDISVINISVCVWVISVDQECEPQTIAGIWDLACVCAHAPTALLPRWLNYEAFVSVVMASSAFGNMSFYFRRGAIIQYKESWQTIHDLFKKEEQQRINKWECGGRRRQFYLSVCGWFVLPDDDVLCVDCLQENDYLHECLEVVQQEFMIFNRERWESTEADLNPCSRSYNHAGPKQIKEIKQRVRVFADIWWRC